MIQHIELFLKRYPWTSFTNGYGDVVDNMLGRQVSYAGDQSAGRNRRRNGGFDPNNYGPDEIVPFEGDQKLFQDSPPKLKGGSPKSLKRGGRKQGTMRMRTTTSLAEILSVRQVVVETTRDPFAATRMHTTT